MVSNGGEDCREGENLQKTNLKLYKVPVPHQIAHLISFPCPQFFLKAFTAHSAMAKLNSPLVLLAGVLCFVAFAAVADAITVEGKVYCDTCRLGFETFATYYIPGAKVKVDCVNKVSRKVTFTGQGETDGKGTYRVEVPGEHEEDLCNVYLVSSPVKGCKEVQAGRDHGIVVLTDNNGIVSDTRYASPLGFFKAEPLASCPDVVKKYHF